MAGCRKTGGDRPDTGRCGCVLPWCCVGVKRGPGAENAFSRRSRSFPQRRILISAIADFHDRGGGASGTV